MSLIAAHQMGYRTAVYFPKDGEPAMEMATHRMVYDWNEPAGITRLLQVCDVITTEWENIPLDFIRELEQRGGIVRPGSKVLEVAQSRFAEKIMAQQLGISTTSTMFIPAGYDIASVEGNWAEFLPGILKTDGLGYDGKGQYPVKTTQALIAAHKKAGVGCVLEKRVKLKTELSVLVARTADGRVSVSDVVENEHKDGILHTSSWPMIFTHQGNLKVVRDAAVKIAGHLELEGVLVMEFFVDEGDNVLFNEMAPRPHNSFHGSIEAARTSQFEQHIRAICGLSLGAVEFHSQFEMENLIGGTWEEDWSVVLMDEFARLHLYGKAESRPDRKMGHVTRLKR